MPLGPSVVLTAAATALAAMILLLRASFPRVLSVPSLKIMMGCPPSCVAMNIILQIFVIAILAGRQLYKNNSIIQMPCSIEAKQCLKFYIRIALAKII
jgi:hypothetical protein